ncbi:MAG: D-glycero-alpha-D-manno-heptose-1,7-bisphosphate 7-phosphatase [Bacteroidota bacterium]
MAEPAVFIDKDGTLIDNVPYNVEAEHIRLATGASVALRMLRAAGFRLIVVSNQSGVARGYFSEDALQDVKHTLEAVIQQAGGRLDAFYYCPHHPEGNVAGYTRMCNCRKPAAGMLFRAAAEHDIDLQASWMIGDILHDVQAGRAAGCRTILIDNGNETEWLLSPERTPHFRVADLAEAAETVIRGKPADGYQPIPSAI